jgi:hypothetical protein
MIIDLKNIIDSQSIEIIKLNEKIKKLEKITKEEIYKKCVLQEIKYYYILNKKEKIYNNLLKGLLYQKMKKRIENDNSYIII